MNQKIEDRLVAMGTRLAEVDERFVRGTGLGGRKIKMVKPTPLFLFRQLNSADEQVD